MAGSFQLNVVVARAFQVGGCACLMGCAVTSPLATTQIGGARVEAISQIDFPAPEAAQAQAGELHTALMQELDRRNIEFASGANTLAQMSYSASPSSIGLYTNHSASSDEEAVTVVETMSSHWYDRCKTIRVRASLALFEKDSGNQLGSSTVQATICEGGAAEHAEVAKLLIDNVLAR